MRLPNWMMLCVLLVGAAAGQYSVNAVASMPAFSGNFAQLVSANEMPAIGEMMNNDADRAGNTSNPLALTPIDINTADAQALAVLPGIGAKKAQAIVDYRVLNGKFLSVEELVNVRGIGPKMLAKLNGFVTV